MNNFIYLFPFLFVAFFIFVIYLLSKMAWSKLAEHYHFDETFEGQRYGIMSLAINKVNYKNCMLVKYNEYGLYMRPVFIFGLFHKPVLIPWADIVEIRDSKFVFFTAKELVIGNPNLANIQMHASSFTRLWNASAKYRPAGN